MDISRQIEFAQGAAKQGDRISAQLILKQVLEQEPRNVAAWLALAEFAETPVQARQCLVRALRYDPENPASRAQLRALDDPQSNAPANRQAREYAAPPPAPPTLERAQLNKVAAFESEPESFTLAASGVEAVDALPSVPAFMDGSWQDVDELLYEEAGPALALHDLRSEPAHEEPHPGAEEPSQAEEVESRLRAGLLGGKKHQKLSRAPVNRPKKHSSALESLLLAVLILVVLACLGGGALMLLQSYM